LQHVAKGKEIVIARDGDAIAKLVPFRPPFRRRFGIDEGVFRIPNDFDASLSEPLLEDFER
jgi:antitoxin (DNA-binding transcriptional repressor) of toxin-antitoxin stability system